jgi:non-heme chloroperoxidase
MKIKTVELPSGIELPYVEQGDPRGVPVLLLHGVTDSWRSFTPVLPHLPDSIRAIALTQRGHGDAERPVGAGYRISDLAEDAAAVIEALDLAPAIVVGHSMGAWVAQKLAIDRPELVRGAVLVGAIGAARDNEPVAGFAVEVQAIEEIEEELARDFQEETIAHPLPRGAMDTFVEESMKLPTWLWRELFAGFVEDDLVPELGLIEAPALLVWGDQDAFARQADQKLLLASIPDAELKVYEGIGHAVHWEQPQRVAAEVSAFAQRLSRTMSSSDVSGRSKRALTA